MTQKKPPGPSYFSSTLEFVGGTLDYYLELMEDYGDIVKVPSIIPVYLINNAEMLKYVLKDNSENYIREGIYSKPLRVLLGNGLLQLKGDEWRKRRKSLAPSFQPKNIAEFVPIIQKIAKMHFEVWDKNYLNGSSFDISQETMKIAYRIALLAFFGQQVDDQLLEKLLRSINDVHTFAMKFALFYFWLPTPTLWRYYRAKKIVYTHINSIIQFGKEHPSDNFLNVLLHTTDSNNNPISEQAIFDEVRTFLMTGHETSATAIAWAMYLLSENPEVQKKLKEELHTVLAGRDPEWADLVNLPYTQATFNETIRLFPPIWGTNRICQADDKIGDYFIRKKSIIIICPYTLHRREMYWENPLAFQPERHFISGEKKPPQFAFLPFGGGPRSCIASHFATMECVMIIAMIMQRYTIRLDADHPIELEPLISLKPRYGIKVFLDKDS